MTLAVLDQPATDPAFVQNPYPFYDRARRCGPLFFWRDYDIACSAHYSTVNAILRDRRFGREPPPGFAPAHPPHLAPFYALERNSMLEREPPFHTRIRGLVLRAFTSRRIAALGPEIVTLAHRLIDEFEGGSLDLLPAFAEKIPVIVIARLLGVPEDMAGQLLRWSHDMVAMYQARQDRGIEDRAVAATLAFSGFVGNYIEQRRETPRDDLITHLIAAERDGGRLSTDEMVTTCILLLNAGHEATVHALGNGINAVLQSDLKPSDLYRNADATAACNEEILRFDPPLHMFKRFALSNIDIAGHSFRAGQEVGLLLAGANRDPDQFDAPDRFAPARPVSPNLAFGAGLHFCVGAPLARLEMAVALPILFERHPAMTLAETPAYADRYHFHGLDRLQVSL